MHFVQKVYFCKTTSVNAETDQAIYNLRHNFEESMNDDFNVAGALASLFQFTRRINKMIDVNGISDSNRKNILNELERISSVLGVMDLEQMKADKEIELLIKQREEARMKKDWDKADSLRQKIKEMGIEVVDTKQGSMWRKSEIS